MRTTRLLLLWVSALTAAVGAADDRFNIGATLGAEVSVTVHVPAQYADTSLRFPVLYVLDADVQMPHAISSMEFLARTGRVPPMIVVGINNKNDRVRDFTPTRGALVGAGGRVDFQDSGGARTFAAVLRKELIPLIDMRYRTRPFRILVGHSLAGLFALCMAADAETSFGAFIAASPTLTWDDDYVERALTTLFKGAPPSHRDVFVMMGAEEAPNVAAFYRIRGLLVGGAPKAFRWSAELAANEDHNSTPLIALYDGLRFVFAGWQASVESFRGLTDLESHYQKLSERLHYLVEAPERTVNAFGYHQLAAGNLVEAIRAFRRNVERFPASANVYDSLGDALERQKDYRAARDAYAKAVEIARRNGDSNVNTFVWNLKRVEVLLGDKK